MGDNGRPSMSCMQQELCPAMCQAAPLKLSYQAEHGVPEATLQHRPALRSCGTPAMIAGARHAFVTAHCNVRSAPLTSMQQPLSLLHALWSRMRQQPMACFSNDRLITEQQRPPRLSHIQLKPLLPKTCLMAPRMPLPRRLVRLSFLQQPGNRDLRLRPAESPHRQPRTRKQAVAQA